MSGPIVFCKTCGTVMAVKPDGRGFPPSIAQRKLAKSCKSRDCDFRIDYRAGMSQDLIDLLEGMRNRNG
jgi:hypothetical protein